VMRMNACAEKLIGKGLQIVSGRLKAIAPEDCLAIDSLLVNLADTDVLAKSVPDSIVIRRVIGKPLILSAIRLGPSLKDWFGGLSAVVIVSDLEEQRVPDKSLLARAFGLSAAESLVAMRIAAGQSIEQCAVELRLTDGTVRQLVKQVFIKSDTHRQGEFISLANRIVAPRPRGDEPLK
jgi:DNA-binding CsgD family transcriptional regulator